MDYVIWIYSGLHNLEVNLIFKKDSRLCNPEANHSSEKKTSGLHNLEANFMYRKDFRIM